jgi:hypothetical protein
MIELRWLEQNTGKRLMNEWGYYYPETTKTLQYRTQVVYHRDRVVDGDAVIMEELVWTPWRSVPTVSLDPSLYKSIDLT